MGEISLDHEKISFTLTGLSLQLREGKEKNNNIYSSPGTMVSYSNGRRRKRERRDIDDSRPLPFLFALNKQVWSFFTYYFFFTLADICTNVFSQRVKEEKDERYQTFNVRRGWGGGKRQWRERKTVKTFGSQQRVCSLAGLQISKPSDGGGVSCLEHMPTCLNKAPCRDKRYPREGNINWGLTVYGIKKILLLLEDIIPDSSRWS